MNVTRNIALSGLQAAATRLQVSAANVANLTARGEAPADGGEAEGLFKPGHVVQTATANGGTAAKVRPVEPAHVLIPDPNRESGVAAVPNVNLANELVQQTIAETSFKANAAVLRTVDEIEETLLNIKRQP